MRYDCYQKGSLCTFRPKGLNPRLKCLIRVAEETKHHGTVTVYLLKKPDFNAFHTLNAMKIATCAAIYLDLGLCSKTDSFVKQLDCFIAGLRMGAVLQTPN
jgi:hypothetical protein